MIDYDKEYEEIGFSESICNDISWDKLIRLSFVRGIDVGGSQHPLANTIKGVRVIDFN